MKLLVLGLAPIAIAVPAAAAAAECDVLDYASWREAPGQQWDYRDGGLTMIGASHSRDPGHEQFPRIAAAFAEARPTLVLFEGPDRGIGADAEATIREAGESGYLRFLAHGAGVPARSLEPPPPEQLKMLLAEFPADQVLLFFVLREATRLRDREGLSGEALERTIARLFPRIAGLASAGGIALPFADTAGLQAAFARYWPDRDWKEAEAHWFQPGGDDGRTGGVFAAAINRADSTNRNRHLVRILREAIAAGERPFVLIGRNHVPMVVPALRCAAVG